jgi:type I restriction enzyme R subunit
MTTFTESVVEQAALAWVESAGWSVKSGGEIAPGEPGTERDDYGQVVLAQRLRDTLLPKLISGELRIQDAKRIIDRATA